MGKVVEEMSGECMHTHPPRKYSENRAGAGGCYSDVAYPEAFA